MKSYFFLAMLLFAVLIASGCTQQINCEQLRENILAQIGQANYCSADPDCTSRDFGCVTGCGALVNRTFDFTAINEQVALYEKNCECGPEPLCERMPPPVCASGKCQYLTGEQ